jgi:diguanylate cyclase (GGDEF)-like protein/PAS domain S-box-containing protein
MSQVLPWLASEHDLPLMVLVGAFGVLLAILAAILATAFARRIREKDLSLATALQNMTQGVVMFENERFVVCNDRYLEMYGLSSDVIKPGCKLKDVIRHRIEVGSLDRDFDDYYAELVEVMKRGKTMTAIVESTDGRAISVINRPFAGGFWVGTHEDITERRHAERELERTKSFLDAVIESVPATIVVKSAQDCRYVFVNRAGERCYGIPREKMIGKTAQEVFPARTAAFIADSDRRLMEFGEDTYDQQTIETPGNGTRIVNSRRLAIRGEDRQPQYFLGVIEDVTERKRAEDRIAHLAQHDALTDLPNRAAFTQHLQATLQAAGASDEGFAVLCLDVDRFKDINDVFGHSAGDAFLCDMSRRLREAAGEAFLARLGGDEFALVANGAAAAAAALAERLLNGVAEECDIEGHRLRTTLSIGIAIRPSDGTDVTTLLANADAALRRAKADGRGTIRFFHAATDQQLREQRALQHELRSALDNGELAMHYQPQASTGGTVTGFEALIRWHHPSRGLVPPGIFIPLAEESGFIIQLGEWILREVCREAASWPKPLQVAINLSPVQFRHGDLPGLVHSVLLESGLSPDRLELEITEGVLIGDYSRATASLRRLKALGVRIAMDDFGTGYSSLSYLHAFPFDKIKIDRAFVSGIDRNSQAAAIIRAVIGLARGLNLPVVAEGVETEEQLAFLSDEACDEVQGYLIGRPGPIEHYADTVGRPVRPAPAPAQAALAG